MPPLFPPRLQTGIPSTYQTDPRLRTMDPTAVPGGAPPGGKSGMGRGRRFGALLAGGLGGLGQGMMSPEFRRAYQLGAGGVEDVETSMKAMDKTRLANQDAVTRFLRRKALMAPAIKESPTI